MLNNFCFHVIAQKSLFIGENCNAFFSPLFQGTKYISLDPHHPRDPLPPQLPVSLTEQDQTCSRQVARLFQGTKVSPPPSSCKLASCLATCLELADWYRALKSFHWLLALRS